MTAQLDVLAVGYAKDRVASTVVLIRDGGTVAVVDPGMVARRSAILRPLAALGLAPEQVTDVIFSHHHPDHTLNAALFTEARFHDHWAIYQDDVWIEREADGFALSPHIELMSTPGHSAEDQERARRMYPPVVVRRRSRHRPVGARSGAARALEGNAVGAPAGRRDPRPWRPVQSDFVLQLRARDD
jgi:Metallo-beta-lactamase superfamily